MMLENNSTKLCLYEIYTIVYDIRNYKFSVIFSLMSPVTPLVFFSIEKLTGRRLVKRDRGTNMKQKFRTSIKKDEQILKKDFNIPQSPLPVFYDPFGLVV